MISVGNEIENSTFITPATITLSGTTSSGKSTWVEKLLLLDGMFDKQPRNVFYCYGVYQPRFERLAKLLLERKNINIHFIQGLPVDFEKFLNDAAAADGYQAITDTTPMNNVDCGVTSSHHTQPYSSNSSSSSNTSTLSPSAAPTHKSNLIVFDDLQDEVTNSKAVEKLFTRDSHHRNLSVIYINQNMFYAGKSARTIALNTHYTVLFRNPRAASQIRELCAQTGFKYLLEAYNDAIAQNQFGYLVVDSSPYSKCKFKLRTCIFPTDAHLIVYE